MCGYNKHPSALCFDHLPQFEKAELTKNGCSKRTNAGGMYRLYDANIPIEELINEIKKCRILCSNCHMEVTHHKNTRANINVKNEIHIDHLEEILYMLEGKESIISSCT